ncbi:MAG TPA: DUF4232 domain-containing protein [Actinophytocola sp.]|uniref:DUF4232 domain-containing protein n=1 Tax=Actinophytocola sp. TaxID=1872138 RepID=UPI002DBF4FAC|nr:DUF4232 domain-containing protein [Actinophytocola sp.]HEU5469179.1 DUF4232 domain-containing protein [Actinophytocola sp.]
MARRLLVVGVLAGLVLAACGKRNEAGWPPPDTEPPVVDAPATLLPDGTVPWVDEPGGQDEFSPPAAQRREDPNAQPCTAEELTGVLASWQRPGGLAEAEGVPQREPPKLIGYVRVTNTGQRTCRLRGEVPTRLRDSAGDLAIDYTHGINAQSRERATIVPPGQSADLRLDWTGPFCQAVHGPLELEISLPEDGGTLRAAVTTDTTPPCTRSNESRPERTSNLASSGFDEPAREPGPDSPMATLRATVEPPAGARPGDRLTFSVRLANPTAVPIALEPCPGYLLERLSMGSATTPAINDSATYRLNCRPLKEIPAQGEVRFEMVVLVPPELTAGRELTVTWRLIGPNLLGAPNARGQFNVTIQ